jgi:hypothetical protein
MAVGFAFHSEESMAGRDISQNVREWRAEDGRLIALLVRGDFAEYQKFRPFVETAVDQAHLAAAYAGRDPARERRTKAHLTDNELPLQITILNREKGSSVAPHYHVAGRMSQSPTRHQIMLCERGTCKVGIYTKEGKHLDDVTVYPKDFILLCEGHAFEVTGEDTKLIEIKQGPIPETDAQDMVRL